MTWTVKVEKVDGKHRVHLTYSSWDEDRIILSTQANTLANQLLVAASECARLNNPPKKFYA